MGFYDLIDAYEKNEQKRKVFKFLLKPKIDLDQDDQEYLDMLHNRKFLAKFKKRFISVIGVNVEFAVQSIIFILIIFFLFRKVDHQK